MWCLSSSYGLLSVAMFYPTHDLTEDQTRSRSDVKSGYLFEREGCFRNPETLLQKLKMNVC